MLREEESGASAGFLCGRADVHALPQEVIPAPGPCLHCIQWAGHAKKSGLQVQLRLEAVVSEAPSPRTEPLDSASLTLTFNAPATKPPTISPDIIMKTP